MIMLDPGHGGADTGAVSHDVFEDTIVLSLTKQIEAEMIHRHISYKVTRHYDRFVGLGERADIANEMDVDLFVSIHANYFSDPSVSGYELHHYPNSNSGSEASKAVTEALSCQDYIPQRGTKESRFYVLENTTMPAILIETGFISNSNDKQVLTDLTKTQHLAYHIVDGIEQYIS